MGERLTEEEARVQTELSAEAVPRRMFIQKSDLEQHGYTAGCPGCRSLLSGRVRQMHSADCRRRFELILKDEPKAKAARLRENQWLEKVLETEDRKRKASMPDTVDDKAMQVEAQ